MSFTTGFCLILMQIHLSLCPAYTWSSSTTNQITFGTLLSSYFVHAVSSSSNTCPSISTCHMVAHPWATYPYHFYYTLETLTSLLLIHCREMIYMSLFPLSFNLIDSRYLYIVGLNFLHSKFKAQSICCCEFLIYSHLKTFYEIGCMFKEHNCWKHWELTVFISGRKI